MFFIKYSSQFYQITLQDSNFKHFGNIVNHDQLASQKPSDLDPHCFRNHIYKGKAYKG